MVPDHQGHQAALLIPLSADLLEATRTSSGAESQTTGRHGDDLREPSLLHPGDQINIA